MSCCDSPKVSFNDDHSAASCTCGFRWNYTQKGHGKFKFKNKRWVPAWFCADEYDRAWRFKNYERHEIVGKRRIGYNEEWVVACPRHGVTLSVNVNDESDDVYCPNCERTGRLGPMIARYRERGQDRETQ